MKIVFPVLDHHVASLREAGLPVPAVRPGDRLPGLRPGGAGPLHDRSHIEGHRHGPPFRRHRLSTEQHRIRPDRPPHPLRRRQQFGNLRVVQHKRHPLLRMELQRFGHRLSDPGGAQFHGGLHGGGSHLGHLRRQVQPSPDPGRLHCGLLDSDNTVRRGDRVLAVGVVEDDHGGGGVPWLRACCLISSRRRRGHW
jgi:hypothetical protein